VIASAVVKLAVRLLPAPMRDRYREQWLADCRDASEAGLRPTNIAFAALAFAVTFDRPLPARSLPTAKQRAQRSRLGIGLALSAALLSLSMFPRISFGGVSDLVVWDYTAFFLSALLIAYAVLAPISALVIVRGSRARLAVVLLAIATTAPLMAAFIDSAAGYGDYFSAGSGAFAVAATLIAVACALLWRPNGRSLRAPLLGGMAVWGISAAGLAYAAFTSIPSSTPPSFGEGNEALYAEWIAAESQFRVLLVQVFWGWAFAGVVLGAFVIVFGRRMSERRAFALGIVAVAFSLLGASGVFGFIELGMFAGIASVLLGPLRLMAQLLLVVVTLVAVGGVRYARRPASELAAP
jgi:hypothetical protein